MKRMRLRLSVLTWNMAANASISPQGLRPAHISNTTHPRLQISTLAEYPCPLTECTTSGAIQKTDPFKLVEMIES